MFTWSESCCLFGVFSLVVARHYFGTLTLRCSPAVVWCGLPFFSSPLPPSVSHRVSLPPPFSSFHIKDVWMSLADRASGLDTKCRGQLFALPTERGSVKILSSWKEPKIPTILQNLLHLCYRLWTFIVVSLFVLTDLTVICHSESLRLFKLSRIWLKSEDL